MLPSRSHYTDGQVCLLSRQAAFPQLVVARGPWLVEVRITVNLPPTNVAQQRATMDVCAPREKPLIWFKGMHLSCNLAYRFECQPSGIAAISVFSVVVAIKSSF